MFLLFHVNTTGDNRRTNMAVGCSTRDQRTNGNKNQNDSRFQFVNTLSKSQQHQINVTSRRYNFISRHIQANSFIKNLMRKIYASEILSFHKDDVLK